MLNIEIYSPTSLAELSRVLSDTGGRLLAGGTDLLPQIRRKAAHPACLVDAGQIAELKFIRQESDGVRIGALTTHTEAARSPLLQFAAPSLVQAIRTVGCPQTRNRGTLGGNLANASPAADTVPPLLTLDAGLRLASLAETRDLPMLEFFTGPGQTALRPGEFIHSISFQPPAGRWGAAFLKLGRRSGMAISVVSVAAVLFLGLDGAIAGARVALGSVAPTAVRSRSVEAFLAGQPVSEGIFHQAGQAVQEDIDPISDVRATAAYRRHCAAALVERALQACVKSIEGRAL